MKTPFLLIVGLVGLIMQCRPEPSTKIYLSAEGPFNRNSDSVQFKLFADSSYTFVRHTEDFNHKVIETFTGQCVWDNDTLRFHPFRFEFSQNEKAVIKNQFIEFIGGNYPLRLKIRISAKPLRKQPFTQKNYAVFTYHGLYHSLFNKPVKPYELQLQDLIEVDSLLTNYFKTNQSKFEIPVNKYYKQVVAVTTSKGEKEICVLCSCADLDTYEYYIRHTLDGGNCYVSVWLNLSKHRLIKAFINGEA